MTQKSYKPKSPEEIKRNMSAIRAKDNRTEAGLRKALFKMGYRYRKYLSGLPGRPDIVFAKQKIAIFVDGDFWHARAIREAGPDSHSGSLKTANKDYWNKKFKRRVEIDIAVNKRLSELGWCVLRFWESEIKGDLTSALAIITYNLKSRTRQAIRPLEPPRR